MANTRHLTDLSHVTIATVQPSSSWSLDVFCCLLVCWNETLLRCLLVQRIEQVQFFRLVAKTRHSRTATVKLSNYRIRQVHSTFSQRHLPNTLELVWQQPEVRSHDINTNNYKFI